MSDDPPYEMKGKGTPVRGIKTTCEAIFTNACMLIKVMIPAANNFPKRSGAAAEIINPKKARAIKRPTNNVAPINPASSANIENIESVVDSGRYAYF